MKIKFTVKLAAVMIAVSACVMIGAVNAYAEYESGFGGGAFGENEAAEKLPHEVKDRLEELLPDGGDGVFDPSLESVVSFAADTLKNGIFQPVHGIIPVIGVIILSCALGSFLPENRGGRAFGAAEGSLILLLLFEPVGAAIRAGVSLVSAAADFETALIPAFAAAVTASGNPRLALSYSSFSLLAAQGVQLLAKNVVLPLTAVSLGLGLTEAFSPELKISGAAATLAGGAKSAFGTAAGLFSAVLGVKAAVADRADGLLAKSVKTAAGFVPVVGSALGEAYSPLRSGLSLISASVGSFGIFAVLALLLPAVVQLFLWCIVLKIAETAAVLADDTAAAGVARAAHSAAGTVNVLIIYCGAVFVVSCGLVLGLSGD